MMRLLASLLLVISTAGALGAREKPPLPGHFQHALRLFLLIEEKIEHLEWRAAEGINDAVSAEFARALPELRGLAPEAELADLARRLDLLRQSIRIKDQEAGQTQCAELEKTFFLLVERFSWKAHPVFAILDADVREALERVQVGDLRHAAFETAEIETYFGTARRLLEDRWSAEEIVAFDAEIDRAAEALRSGDAVGAEAALTALAEKSAPLLAP